MLDLLDEVGVPVAARAPIVVAVRFRLTALARLETEPAYAAWTLKEVMPGVDLLHRTLIETAATQPLIEDGGEPAFEPDAFFRAALERCEGAGWA